MIDPRSQTLLQEIARRESRSLLRYVGDAFPWTTVQAQESLADFQKIVHEDAESLNSLIRFLGRCRIALPPLGAYPGWFTTINFVSLKHLQPQMVEAERKSITRLEQDLQEIPDESARQHLQTLVEQKRQRLQQLEALTPVEELVARAAG